MKELLQRIVAPIGRNWIKVMWQETMFTSEEISNIASEVKRIMTAFGYDVNHRAASPVVKVYKDMGKTLPGVMGVAYPAAGLVLVPNVSPDMEVLYHELTHHHQSAELMGKGSVGVSLTLQQYSELEFEVQAWTVQAAYKMLAVQGDDFWSALDLLAKEGPVNLLDLATELDLVDYMESQNVNLQDVSQWIQDFILGTSTTADKRKAKTLKEAA